MYKIFLLSAIFFRYMLYQHDYGIIAIMISRRSSQKTTLVQLPVPDAHSFYQAGNVPVASGYLKAYAKEKAGVNPQEITIIPRELANYGGDTAIVHTLIDSSPDVIGFTCYMWNIERNLLLADKIKNQNPRIKIICGGPEIDEDHFALAHPAVDSWIIGEGEAAFSHILDKIAQNQPLPSIFRSEQYLDPIEIPNPYLEHIIHPQPGESIFFETMRGCPCRCSYCYYSKFYPKIRLFPEERLQQLFSRIKNNFRPELYLMDPSFNAAPDIVARLERFAAWNRTNTPIHTEVRLEFVTPEIADGMKAAGIRSVEAGLQSVNPLALKAVNRSWDREKFIIGANLLKDRSIEIKTGVILGLPFDTTSTIRQTIDFVIEIGLEQSMEFYPLAVLPGTRLKLESEKFNLAYMSKPPYWVTSHPGLSTQDLRESINWIEHTLDIDFFPAIAPTNKAPIPGFTFFLDVRKKSQQDRELLTKAAAKTARRLTIIADQDTPLEILRHLGINIQEYSPSTLIQLVIDSPSIPTMEMAQTLTKMFAPRPGYFDRIHFFKPDIQRQFSFRLFHMTADLNIIRKVLNIPAPFDLVVKYTPGLLSQAPDVFLDHPIILVETDLPQDEVRALQNVYQKFPHLLLTDF